ncbi:retrovirus-related pol polyprotein from transposon TNT 1-94 [Tanacetum coccineum]
MKKELCAHQETISIMSQAKEAQIKLYKTREDKELEKVIALENKVKDLKAQMQDKNISISELKKLIEKCKGKSMETQFDKPYVVRQPNARRIPKPSVLGKLTPFLNSPEMRSFQTNQSVNKTNVSDGSSKQVTQQNLPQNRKQAEIHTNTLTPGMYRIATSTTQNREPQLPHASRNTNPHVSTSTGVNHSTSVSRPPLKSYQVKDKVVPNNSQVKFTKKEVEDHHRISSISKNTKSVTAYNDSSNSRTSNVNVVCAECGKCVFNSNHDACVSKYLNDVNAKTKKPKGVPMSASKPKRKMIKSVATPHKKKVASNTTIQKPKSYFKELYENTNKAWKWWIEKKCPSEYKWTQTTPSRPSLKWKPTGRIFSNVRLRWIPTGKLLNSCTGKVESEPTHGSNVDIPHIHACKQTLGLSAGTSFNGQKQQRIDLNADALYNAKQENLRVWLLKLLISKKPVPEWHRVLDQGTLHAYFKEEELNFRILHSLNTLTERRLSERSIPSLVEATRTMLSASKLPLSFWAEAVATACYTQNRSIIISTHGKTAYHIINDRKPSIKHLHIFVALLHNKMGKFG